MANKNNMLNYSDKYNMMPHQVINGVCMLGRIHSDQKCPVCGGRFKHDENRHGLFCSGSRDKRHPDVAASKRFRVYFGITYKRFKTFYEAERFLTVLRVEQDRGVYDPRDYQKDAPLGFTTLALEFIRDKERLGLVSINNIKNYLRRACDYWGQKNVKDFTKKDIRQFLYSIEGISEKTRHNHKSCLHNFFTSLCDDEVINTTDLPKFPEVSYKLGRRAITTIEIQNKIIDEVRRISYHINPKIYLGIEILSVYTILRPQDLLRVTEADIDLEYGVITFWTPTKSNNDKKITVRLIDEHIELIKEIRAKNPGMPNMPFFRHVDGISGIRANALFGPKYFKKWWDKACANLCIEGLDLYGGTRHTTTTALAKEVGEDGAKKASGHRTNKAFYRYCQYQDDGTFEMAKITAGLKKKQKGDVVRFSQKQQN